MLRVVQRSYLVLDIETILDPNLPLLNSTDSDGLPPPPHHEIVCIGVMWLDAEYTIRRLGIIGEDKDEPGVLADFARFLEAQRPTLVTYNGRGFDMPVIAARCLRHGQPFVHYYRDRDVRYRFSPEGHLDLMDFISDFAASKRSRLDVMAKLCGMPGKVGVDGKDVGPMIHAGRIAEVRNYCLCDVVQTGGVFLRVQLVRGEIDRGQYLAAMRGLMRTTLDDSRVADVADAWDAERLLLGDDLEPSADQV
jgi:predicted PolB exonuclease-like 3'-5' exonuclease